MATVQELLLANKAQRSPFMSLLEGAAQGGVKAQDEGLDRNIKLIQLDQLRSQMAAQEQMRNEIAKTMESQTQQNLTTAAGGPKPVQPAQKLKTKITQDDKGQYSRTFEVDSQDAADSKIYTPEQVQAIKTGDPAQLAKVFPTGIPKDAVTLAYSADRIANLENERNQQRDERTKARYRNYVLDIEQHDPVIKAMNQQDLGLGQVDSIMGLVKGGNTIAANALGAKMARGMGEVGVLTQQDVVRYVQSGKLSQGAADKLLKMMTGVPTDATLNEIGELTKVLRQQFQDRIQPNYDKYIQHYAKIEGVAPEQFAADVGFRYNGGAKPTDGGGLPGETPEQRKARLIQELNNAPK